MENKNFELEQNINKTVGEGESKSQEEKISKEEIEKIINNIKDIYKKRTKEILQVGDPLKEKILDYFVNRPEVNNEYNYILSNLSNSEKRNYVHNLENSLKDDAFFINKMERYFTVQNIYENEKQLKEKPRIATEEEYQIGAYSDFIEPQVAEAVFALNKKGYKTFQSGFSEKDPKNQFIDFYNSEIEIPEKLKQILLSYGIKTQVEKLNDRTTLTLIPIDSKKIIRQEEWKKIWDDFSKEIPISNYQFIKNTKEPTLNTDFRKIQDILKRLKN